MHSAEVKPLMRMIVSSEVFRWMKVMVKFATIKQDIMAAMKSIR